MLHILAVTTPFFALVLLGWSVVRLRPLPLDTIPGLNGFVLFFALPCMLFRFSAMTPIAQLLDSAVVTVYLASAAVMGALAVLVATQGAALERYGVRRAGRGLSEQRLHGSAVAGDAAGLRGGPLAR